MSKTKLRMEEGWLRYLIEILIAELRSIIRQEIKQLKKDEYTLTENFAQTNMNNNYPINIYFEDDFEVLFGIKKRTQQDYRAKGKLGSCKPGEKVFYTQKHIDEFLERFDSKNLNKMID